MSIFNTDLLTHRPPTPPVEKDTDECIKDAIKFLDISYAPQHASQLETPPQSSPTRGAKVTESHRQPTKRLRFVSEPSFCDEIEPSRQPAFSSQRLLRPVPNTKDLRSLKSILKPFDKPGPANAETYCAGSAVFASFADMLECIVKQLARGTQSAKLDGYNVLNNALRAYDKIPHPDELVAKLSPIEDFVRRDITDYRQSIDHPNMSTAITSKLAMQSLKLIAILMGETHRMCCHMRRDFLDWLMDDTILAIQSDSSSKEVSKNQLYLLTLDDFLAHTNSVDRSNRILSCLANLHHRMSGDGIQCLRLMIYGRLIERAKPVMAKGSRLWIPVIFHGILSNSKELSKRAIEAGMRGANVFGSSNHTSGVLRDFLDQKRSDSKTNFELIESSMKRMLARASENQLVPQIWTIVILFLRGDTRALENWKHLRPWFKIIEKCFNTKNSILNLRALIAWNQLIRAISLTPLTKPKFLKALKQPLLSQLQRSQNGRLSKRVREAALSSVRLLVFYAFRPGYSGDDYKTLWDYFVSGLLERFQLSDREQLLGAHRIFSALLYQGKPGRLWSPEEVGDNITDPILAKDIPRLDPQWIRANIGTVAHTMKALLDPHWLGTIAMDSQTQSSSNTLLLSFFNAIQEARSREVKASDATKQASASMVDLLCWLLQNDQLSSLSDENLREQYVNLCWNYIDLMTSVIDPSLLTDRFLLDAHASFVVNLYKPTGHSRTTVSNSLKSPVVVLLEKIFRAIEDHQILGAHVDVLPTLTKCLEKIQTRHSKLEFLETCAESIQSIMNHSRVTSALYLAYEHIAQATAATLNMEINGEISYGEQTLDGRYGCVVAIISSTMGSLDPRIWNTAELLLDSLKASIRRNVGDLALIDLVYLPLKKHFNRMPLEHCRLQGTRTITWLLKIATEMPLQPSLNYASQALLCSSSISLEGGDMRFESLCRATGNALNAAQFDDTPCGKAEIDKLLTAVCHYLESRACLFPDHFLWSIQGALGSWVRRCSDSKASVRTKIKVWRAIMQSFSALPGHNTALLEKFQALFSAGFQSFEKGVAFATIETWNDTFGTLEALEYPEGLVDILLRLQSFVEIRLPSAENLSVAPSQFPENLDVLPWLARITFHDKPEDQQHTLETLNPTLPTSNRDLLHCCIDLSSSSVNASAPGSQPHQAPRSRHYGSQTNLAAVESSTVDVGSQVSAKHQKDVKLQQPDEANWCSIFNSSPPFSKDPQPAEISPRTNDPLPIPLVDGTGDEPGYKYEDAPSTPPGQPNESSPILEMETVASETHESMDISNISYWSPEVSRGSRESAQATSSPLSGAEKQLFDEQANASKESRAMADENLLKVQSEFQDLSRNSTLLEEEGSSMEGGSSQEMPDQNPLESVNDKFMTAPNVDGPESSELNVLQVIADPQNKENLDPCSIPDNSGIGVHDKEKSGACDTPHDHIYSNNEVSSSAHCVHGVAEDASDNTPEDAPGLFPRIAATDLTPEIDIAFKEHTIKEPMQIDEDQQLETAPEHQLVPSSCPNSDSMPQEFVLEQVDGATSRVKDSFPNNDNTAGQHQDPLGCPQDVSLAEGVPEEIRALSHSPDRLSIPVIKINTRSIPIRGSKSAIAYHLSSSQSVTSHMSSKKRKSTVHQHSQPKKQKQKHRLPARSQQPNFTSGPVNDERKSIERDSIVVCPTSQRTPSFYEVLRAKNSQGRSRNPSQSRTHEDTPEQSAPSGQGTSTGKLQRPKRSTLSHSPRLPRKRSASAFDASKVEIKKVKKATLLREEGSGSQGSRRSGRVSGQSVVLLELPQRTRRPNKHASRVCASPLSTDVSTQEDDGGVRPSVGRDVREGEDQTHELARSCVADTSADLDQPILRNPESSPQSYQNAHTHTKTSISVPAPNQTPVSSQFNALTSSPTSLARSLIGRLRGILVDCKTLVLGGSRGRNEEERTELEDLGFEVAREIVEAGRRKDKNG